MTAHLSDIDLASYFKGVLDDRAIQRIEEHVLECEHCSRLLNEIVMAALGAERSRNVELAKD
jgi:hypothetical protein